MSFWGRSHEVRLREKSPRPQRPKRTITCVHAYIYMRSWGFDALGLSLRSELSLLSLWGLCGMQAVLGMELDVWKSKLSKSYMLKRVISVSVFISISNVDPKWMYPNSFFRTLLYPFLVPYSTKI